MDKDGKTIIVTEYWLEKQQIPFADSLYQIKKHIIETCAEDILLKDDTEVIKTDDFILVHMAVYFRI